jgi:hypothetical protein
MTMKSSAPRFPESLRTRPVTPAGAVGLRPEIAHGTANLNIRTLVLWAAVALALAAPGIKSGVFDARSTDDAMRLVEVRDLIGGDKAGST